MLLAITDKKGNKWECPAVGGLGLVSLKFQHVGQVIFEVKEVQEFIKQLQMLCDDATS